MARTAKPEAPAAEKSADVAGPAAGAVGVDNAPATDAAAPAAIDAVASGSSEHGQASEGDAPTTAEEAGSEQPEAATHALAEPRRGFVLRVRALQPSRWRIGRQFTAEPVHLRDDLKEVSRPFGQVAERLVAVLPRNPERTVALRKLLEAKDAAVRAAVFHPGAAR